MRLFVDLEFTSMEILGGVAHYGDVLSIGVVAEDERELYIEVDNVSLRQRCSDFVEDIVLPQFGRHPAIKVTNLAEAGRALADFMAAIDGELVLSADFSGDLESCVQALKSAGRLSPEMRSRTRLELVTSVVYGEGSDEVWSAAFHRRESESGLLRHHALLDARVLKDVFKAMTR